MRSTPEGGPHDVVSTTIEAAGWSEPTKTKNVGAEWDGLLLGLKLVGAYAFSSSPRLDVVLVVDLLWIHAQLIGSRKTLHPQIIEKRNRALKLIEEDELDVTLVHHSGHQVDKSDFTYWNYRADRLCTQEARRRAGPRPRAARRPETEVSS